VRIDYEARIIVRGNGLCPELDIISLSALAGL